MCCFSPVSAPAGFFSWLFRSTPKLHVAATRIFARVIGAEQALVYSMQLSVGGDVAMILPVPVVPGAGEHALTFVDLARYPRLFEDMRSGFELELLAAPLSRGLRLSVSRPRLVVHEVGSFVASYVPTRGDFDRLDPRFRLPDSVWAAMRRYDDWGFAVFQLARGKKKQIHPMAMRFRTREPSKLFFPTVHVHDGKLHDVATFDHELYYQWPSIAAAPRVDPVTYVPARSLLRMPDTEGLFDGELPIARRVRAGALPNEDTWIEDPARDVAAA